MNMKLVRYGEAGQEKPGLLDNAGVLRDLSAHVSDFGGASVSTEFLASLGRISSATLPKVAGAERLGCPLSFVPNFYCIGLNYARHADESGMARPSEPILFSKASSALGGPNDPLVIPRGSDRLDWEVELGAVIGRDCLYVSEEDALDYVSAYCTVNDVSERSFQLDRGGQWIKGKSAPGFGPVGPWLVTAEDVGDPQALDLSLRVNGEVVQSSNTADMIFGLRQIIAHISQFIKLVPGDIIATGTPEGVGMGMKPPRYLKAGDVMEVTVEGLGTQRQEVIAAI